MSSLHDYIETIRTIMILGSGIMTDLLLIYLFLRLPLKRRDWGWVVLSLLIPWAGVLWYVYVRRRFIEDGLLLPKKI